MKSTQKQDNSALGSKGYTPSGFASKVIHKALTVVGSKKHMIAPLATPGMDLSMCGVS
jgi:hypothetical protein